LTHFSSPSNTKLHVNPSAICWHY